MSRFLYMFCLVGLALVWTAGALAAADFPAGKFATMAGNDKYVMDFDGKGTVTVTRNGQLGVEATYKVDKDQIEFKDVKGPIADPNGPAGKYKWKLEGKKLSFTKIEDASAGRAAALTGGPWTKE
jgi:hypothetical protein